MNQASPPPPSAPESRRSRVLALLLLLVGLPLEVAYVARATLPKNNAGDFLMFYTAGRVPLMGRSPYDSGKIETAHPVFASFARDFQRWTRKEGPVPKYVWRWEAGLPYPPQIYLAFVPVSRLPWEPAVMVWLALLCVLGLTTGSLCWTFDLEARHHSWLCQTLVALAFLFNPITANMLSTGQTTMFLCAGVALGQWSLRRGQPWLAAFFWSLTAVKPHIGLQLAALSLLAGGWRFTLKVGAWVLVLNILGGVVTTGDPLMLLKMLAGGSKETFTMNAIDGPQGQLTIGWNRLVYLLTGRAIALSIKTMVAGHLVWMAAIGALAWRRGPQRRSLPYLLAAATCGSLLVTTSHNYDLILLVLLVPYLFWLWDHDQRGDLVVLLGLIAVASLPTAAVRLLLPGVDPRSYLGDLAVSYRPFVVLALCAYFLVRGQPAPWRSDSLTAAPQRIDRMRNAHA